MTRMASEAKFGWSNLSAHKPTLSGVNNKEVHLIPARTASVEYAVAITINPLWLYWCHQSSSSIECAQFYFRTASPFSLSCVIRFLVSGSFSDGWLPQVQKIHQTSLKQYNWSF
ncbi:hypothetical protein CRM22_003391 [Opisthorchis felineus]|uniref:Uncharacterized protein n=1 Tax=Opisthorchis felineus TaxID=147828 RepID=A0A4S2M7K9_OPIFE|nr:hypothetical protein CRM22_003391 [Opisthorchis felineus]